MSRFRSKHGDPVITPGSVKSRTYDGSWGPWSTHLNGNWINQSYKEMTDQKTPGYFRPKREGGILPVSPMTKRNSEWFLSQDSVSIITALKTAPTVPIQEVRLDGFVMSQTYPSVSTPFPTVDTNGALQEALSRAQSDCWDALTWAAEFNKTVASFVSLRERFERLCLSFVQKVEHISDVSSFVNVGKGATVISKLWLELRYAWRPMLYDMEDIQEAMRRLLAGIEDPLQRAYATRSSTNTGSAILLGQGFNVAGSVTGVGYAVCSCTLSSARTTEAHASVGVQATTRDIVMVDPFVTIWEEVPFSFIFDWFVSVGTMIAAFSPYATGTLKYASLAVTKTRIDTYSVILTPTSNTVVLDGSNVRPVNCVSFGQTYERSKPASITPTAEFRVNLNAAKILDLVALWVTFDRRISVRLNRAVNSLIRKFQSKLG